MWIGVLWAGLRVAMWITHVGGKFRHGLLEKSLMHVSFLFTMLIVRSRAELLRNGQNIGPYGARVWSGCDPKELNRQVIIWGGMTPCG